MSRMSQKRWIALAASLLCLAGLGAAPPPGDQEADPSFTVGDFAVRLAQRLGAEEVSSAEEAREALREAGVEVEGTLLRPVQEEDLTEILNQLGYHLTTSQPGRTVDADRADRLLDLFVGIEGRGGEPGVSTSDRGNSPPGGGHGRSRAHASPN